jgi:hypothetical protein
MIFQYSSFITAEFYSKMHPESMCYGQVISNSIFKPKKIRKS